MMKLLANLFILTALVLIVAGTTSRFLGLPIIFADISPLSHLVFANTFLLLALILKVAND